MSCVFRFQLSETKVRGALPIIREICARPRARRTSRPDRRPCRVLYRMYTRSGTHQHGTRALWRRLPPDRASSKAFHKSVRGWLKYQIKAPEEFPRASASFGSKGKATADGTRPDGTGRARHDATVRSTPPAPRPTATRHVRVPPHDSSHDSALTTPACTWTSTYQRRSPQSTDRL